MGFRFQKRINIAPGIRLNLSKSGISTSVGPKGFTVNLRGNRVKTTVGIPGTGLSYSTSTKVAPSQSTASKGHATPWLGYLILSVILLVVLNAIDKSFGLAGKAMMSIATGFGTWFLLPFCRKDFSARPAATNVLVSRGLISAFAGFAMGAAIGLWDSSDEAMKPSGPTPLASRTPPAAQVVAVPVSPTASPTSIKPAISPSSAEPPNPSLPSIISDERDQSNLVNQQLAAEPRPKPTSPVANSTLRPIEAPTPFQTINCSSPSHDYEKLVCGDAPLLGQEKRILGNLEARSSASEEIKQRNIQLLSRFRSELRTCTLKHCVEMAYDDQEKALGISPLSQ